MPKFKDSRLSDDTCPHCGSLLNGAATYGGRPPVPGDASLCIYCGEIGVFGEGLRLSKPSPEDEAAWDQQPGFRKQLAEFKEKVQRAKQRIVN